MPSSLCFCLSFFKIMAQLISILLGSGTRSSSPGSPQAFLTQVWIQHHLRHSSHRSGHSTTSRIPHTGLDTASPHAFLTRVWTQHHLMHSSHRSGYSITLCISYTGLDTAFLPEAWLLLVGDKTSEPPFGHQRCSLPLAIIFRLFQ